MRVLKGHTSPETAFVVADWPYGRTLRCKKRFWIETATSGAKKGQQRVVSQTTNPKRAGEVWNAPKASTYDAVAILFLDDEGRVQFDAVSLFATTEEIDAFAKRWGGQLGAPEAAAIDGLSRFAAAASRVVFSITGKAK